MSMSKAEAKLIYLDIEARYGTWFASLQVISFCLLRFFLSSGCNNVIKVLLLSY